ncbi:fibronectin type III-like domain-contianing protein [Streptomyces bomunensis]|uniref:Exo-alpha-(1->6)-L-arabinopyranosidase n=1 Tax=Streptomyces montanisoli TaxID=2798581 RepID=A0A940MB43_9ACTN|nr:fibronectin type III-like domain-contianing protein [Streptomyces montanisoli]
MEGWYAGQSEGAAIAVLLFGDVNPSGKLPVSFPKALTDLPASTAAQWPGQNDQVEYSEGLAMGYRWYQSKTVTPLFPFGYGLSYTTFGYSALSVTGPDQHGNATVTATVTNTGDRAGADVAQLYITDPAAASEPSRQLKGFQRVDLQPGASEQVSFTLPAHSLSYWNTAIDSWTMATGAYGIAVGDTSDRPQLTGSLNVTSTSTGNSIAISNPAGMSSTAGAGANLALHASDSSTGQSLRWTATGLPAGLAVDPGTGTISGTPTTAGTSTVTVAATDGTGATGSTSFVWTVTPAGGPGGPGGPVVSGLSSTLCMDVQAASTADGTPVQTWTCNGTPAQQWSPAPTTAFERWANASTSKPPAPRTTPRSSSTSATAPARNPGNSKPTAPSSIPPPAAASTSPRRRPTRARNCRSTTATARPRRPGASNADPGGPARAYPSRPLSAAADTADRCLTAVARAPNNSARDPSRPLRTLTACAPAGWA